MEIIEIKELTKIYGNFKAIDDLNLVVEETDFYGFVGWNDSDKSTTIKMYIIFKNLKYIIISYKTLDILTLKLIS